MADLSKTQLATLTKRLGQYVRYYGGWRAVLGSPFLWIAVALSLISYGAWAKDWSDLARSLIPNLLGFSLGSYTILFSIITQKIKRSLKAVRNSNNVAYLYEMNATFFHFVMVQVICLLFTFVFRSDVLYKMLLVAGIPKTDLINWFEVIILLGGFFGTTLLCYSICLTIAAAMVVYRLATIVEPDSGPTEPPIQPGILTSPAVGIETSANPLPNKPAA